MAKKKTEEKMNLDSILFKCRDILRKARNAGSFFEKRDMMLTLVFLRFIGEKFEDGTEVTPTLLVESGIVKNEKDGIKILGNGELKKKLTVKANKFSASAKSAIEAAGGQAEVM